MSKKVKRQSSGIPEKFLERLTEIVGPSLCNQLKLTFVQRPTTFRVNTIKAKKNSFVIPDYTDTKKHYEPASGKEEIIEVLNQNGFKFERVQWYKDAFILKNKTKRELTDLDIYKDGKIYIQSLASMVPPLILEPQPGDKVLDLTAAPGSKTSQIAALMDKQGELVANDSNKVRFFKLKHNMEILGVTGSFRKGAQATTRNLSENIDGGIQHNSNISSTVASKDPSPHLGSVQDFLTLRLEPGSALVHEYLEYFDKILLDAPCSAEARFIEGEPETYGYWKEHKIKEMAYKQRKLLFSAWSALKPGGILVYSTCTFAPEENELQISKFLESIDDAELIDIELPELKRLPIAKIWKGKEINKQVIKKAMRILPTKEIEGFFVIKMHKKTA